MCTQDNNGNLGDDIARRSEELKVNSAVRRLGQTSTNMRVYTRPRRGIRGQTRRHARSRAHALLPSEVWKGTSDPLCCPSPFAASSTAQYQVVTQDPSPAPYPHHPISTRHPAGVALPTPSAPPDNNWRYAGARGQRLPSERVED